MRICIVNTFYYPDIIGGAELSVLKLAEQLYKNGNQVDILCTSDKTKNEVINGVNIHRIKINNIYNPIEISNNYEKLNKLKIKLYQLIDKYNIFNYRLFYKELKKIKPDVIHINNIYGISSVIWSVAHKLRIPMVQTLRDYSLMSLENNNKKIIKKFIYSFASKNIDLVTAPSQYTLNQFTQNGYFGNARKSVVYNAIDFSNTSIKEILEIKKKNLISKEKIKFVFLGRLEKEKGIEFLINTFNEIQEENIELIIAGKGIYEEEIKSISKNNKRINYIGFINEEQIDILLKESDVLIIPSLWPEPFGRVIIEAYKYSMPVIGTISGGIPEIIRNNVTGKLITPNNKEELKEAIKYFLNKENILNFMDNCSKEISNYDIKKQSEEFKKLYDLVINY